MKLIHILVIVYAFLSSPSHSYSACDAIDTHFIIDTDSIINKGQQVEHFIQSIIWNGSSEYSAFSVSLYGKNIISDISSNIIINLNETHSILQRKAQENVVLSQLQTVFNNIISSSETMSDMTVFDAFRNSNNQFKPTRNYKKESILSSKTIETLRDEYFIFDYHNQLLSENNDDLCALLYDDQNTNKNIHFIMGQIYHRIPVKCDQGNVYEDRMDKRTFFNFDNIIDNPEQMEIIYDISCPANIDIDGYGDLSLGNHNQWIDPETIIQCELVQIEGQNIESPLQIDQSLSFIDVKDYLYDDNTFKKNDYLIGNEEIAVILGNYGCWSLVYKITDVQIVDSTNSDYNILRLSVSLPISPLEYISSANVDGIRPIFTSNPSSRRDLASYDFISLSSDGKKTEDLFDEIFDNKWSYSKVNETQELLSIGSSPEFIFSGIGIINTSFAYDLDIDIDVKFKFNWDVLSNDIYLFFKLEVDYSLSMDFNMDFKGELEVAINDILTYSQYMVFTIGVVPVVIKPFISINAKVTTLPIEINADVSCSYGETLSVGYEYDSESVFNAEYGTIREDYKYSLSVTKQWDEIDTFDTCLRQNYEYGAGFGLSCVWFDYNPSEQRCRCYGAGTMVGDTSSEDGTTAYIMNKECGSLQRESCDGCYTDIWVKRDGNSGCFPGWYSWYCISCPLFQDNSGYESTEVTQESLDSRTPHEDNGCVNKELSVSLNDNDLSECPSNDVDLFGFDIEIETEIGCNLYSIITVYGRAVLDIPIRFNMPIFNNTICNNSSNSCLSTLQTAISIAMDLSFYLGVKVDFGDLEDIVADLYDGGSQAINDEIFPASETMIGEYEILPETILACIILEDALSSLDAYFKPKCCSTYFIDQDGDGIDDREQESGKSDASAINSNVCVIIVALFCAFMEY